MILAFFKVKRQADSLTKKALRCELVLQDGGDNPEDNQLERFVRARAFCDIT